MENDFSNKGGGGGLCHGHADAGRKEKEAGRQMKKVLPDE